MRDDAWLGSREQFLKAFEAGVGDAIPGMLLQRVSFQQEMCIGLHVTQQPELPMPLFDSIVLSLRLCGSELLQVRALLQQSLDAFLLYTDKGSCSIRLRFG